MANRNGSHSLKERPIGELMKQLAEETGTLLRKEVELAKAEMLEKIELVRADVVSRAEDAKADLQAAKEELADNGKNAGVGAGLFAGAAAFGLVALGVLAALLARVLDAVMPSWVALLLVLLLYTGAAAALALFGRERLRAAGSVVPARSLSRLASDIRGGRGGPQLQEAWPPVPEQTIETLKEDLEWVKHPTKSAAR